MSQERLIILKLLEQGKITEGEAEQLLDALGHMEYDQAAQDASDAFDSYKINLSKEDEDSFAKDEYTESSKDSDSSKDFDFEDFFQAGRSLGEKIESLGDQLEDKMDVFGEQLGKKMVSLGAVFADKSVDIAGKVFDIVEKAVDSGALTDTLNNLDLFGNSNSYEEVVERKLSGIEQVSLSIEGYNGSIHLSEWDEPIIRVTASISSKESRYDLNKPILELKEHDDILYFIPKQVDWIGIKLKVQLPKQAYNFVKIENRNGSITIDGLDCNKLLLQTKNNSISLSNLLVEDEISCTTTNNKILIENSRAGKLLAVTKNGKIHINNCQFNTVEGLTSNSKITVRDLDYKILQSISLKTTNAKIEIFGEVPQATGLHFTANTTHGNISIDAPVTYVENIKNYSSHRINARTVNFEKADNIVFVKTYTSNASIYFYN